VTRVYLGLGSNLGDRWSLLSDAVDALRDLDSELVISPVYETAPVGGPAGQGRFLNIVVALDSDRSPPELLAIAGSLEQAAGRVRAERFGPRTLDVDVLLIEGYQSDDPQLTVPHPRMWERAFVLAPLHDLDPGLVADDLLAAVTAAEEVRRVGILLRRRPDVVEVVEGGEVVEGADAVEGGDAVTDACGAPDPADLSARA
jgi:2-amino-4-hydroxy-6-hydroxymethyldihydropteridine diphosphokinase